MDRNLALFLFILVALGPIPAQEQPVLSSNIREHYSLDILENIYCWQGSELEKYSSQGALLYRYSNPSYGYITYVDTKIPSKIMVFFKETGTLVLLDNTLSPIGNEIKLWDKGLYTIELATMISTNQLALYDPNAQKLYLMDLTTAVLNEVQFDFPPEFYPTEIDINLDKDIVLTDPTLGLFFFDQFGTYEKRVALTNLRSVEFWNNEIYYIKDNVLYRYDPLSLQNTLISEGLLEVREFKISDKKIYYLDSTGKIGQKKIRR